MMARSLLERCSVSLAYEARFSVALLMFVENHKSCSRLHYTNLAIFMNPSGSRCGVFPSSNRRATHGILA